MNGGPVEGPPRVMILDAPDGLFDVWCIRCDLTVDGITEYREAQIVAANHRAHHPRACQRVLHERHRTDRARRPPRGLRQAEYEQGSIDSE